MNIKDLELGSRIFALLKGKPKTGKSIFAASFPEPYILDLDKRIRSVASWYNGKSIVFDRFDNFTAIMNKMDELVRRCDFGTVIVDGLTFAADMCLSQMIKMRAAEGKDKLKRGGIPVWEVEDFGGEDRGLSYILDALAALPCHAILTAHLLHIEYFDIVRKVSRVNQTLLTGGKKIAAKIPAYFDEIYHFDILPSESPEDGKPRYVFYTQAEGENFAGTCIKNLPPAINWTDRDGYEILTKYIKETRTLSESIEQTKGE